MKRWKRLTAAVLMSASVLCTGLTANPCLLLPAGTEITAQAAEKVTVGDLTFMKYRSYAEVTGCSKTAVQVKIPPEIDGLPVTSIGDWAFSNCKQLTDITIPDGVTNIGKGAFYDCPSLTAVTIPDGVTGIGEDAFYGCKSLKDITIPDSVTNIGGCAFQKCARLKSIQIPYGVTSIGEYTFEECVRLKNVKLPDSVSSIGTRAFYGCTGLTGITLPNSLTGIGDESFGCSGLTSITIPDGVISIGNRAFYYSDFLADVTISDSVTSIGENAFSNCTGLTSVSIGNSVTCIGENAFSNCTGLTSVSIGNSVESIGGGAFWGTPWLDEEREKNTLVIVNHVLIDDCDAEGDVVIPEGVTAISGEAFAGSYDLTSVTIPDSVTSIGDGAFMSCAELKDITIPESVTSIGKYAFSGTAWLKAKRQENPLVIVNHILVDGRASSGNITVPFSVTSIAPGGFSGCTNLTGITIPDHITSIGEHTFSGCTGLTEFTVPDSVTSIGYRAFFECGSLTNVRIPDRVTSIGEQAFYGCPDLTIIGFSGSFAEQYAEKNKIPFRPLRTKIWNSDVTLRETVFHFSGRPVKTGSYISVITDGIKLKYGRDFTLSYADNTEPGKASVTVTGIGKYSGSATKRYTITPHGDVDCDERLSIKDAILLARYLAEDAVSVSTVGLLNAELDGDSTALTAGDLTVLMQYLAGILPVGENSGDPDTDPDSTASDAIDNVTLSQTEFAETGKPVTKTYQIV